MSNKNTPLHNRINSLTTRSVRGSNTSSSGLRHRIVSHTNATSTNEDEVSSPRNSQLLNTAFSSSSANTTPSTSAQTASRYKQKPTALNACYTPSSLYKNAKTTGSGTATPQNTRSTSAVKMVKTPGNSAATTEGTEMSNLTVAVRVRPLNTQECKRTSVANAIRVKGNELTVLAGTTADCMAGLTHSFTYDHVFYSCDPESRQYACQQTVFEGTAAPLISRAFEGYNACLFAYGQTGSGKSYSMMGIEALDDEVVEGSTPNPEAGIIPRFCRELFKRIDAEKDRIHAEIEVSYCEIYNEKIHDLLCVAQAVTSPGNVNKAGGGGSAANTPMHNQQQRHALRVREHPTWGPYVVDLSGHSVNSYEAIRNWLAVGNSQRATAATGMNDKSSRSHSIFSIILNLTEMSDDLSISLDNSNPEAAQAPLQTRRSQINLVDLAGSERISNTSTSGDRLREGVSINKSLLTLGKVIAALSDAKRSSSSNVTTHVPYRESILTWLLRESLGGNSKTVMLATISPASDHIDETLSTLRYACQARTIVNRVKVNESPHDKIIRELRAEVDRLKSLRNEYERQRRLSENSNPTPRKIIIETSVDEAEVEALRQQLAERERELVRAQKSWMERLKEAEDQRKHELRFLKRKGLALEISAEQKQACLVNLTVDPILSGTLFYLLPRGTVKIGRTRTSAYCSQPDIVLEGPLVGYHHCIIENENDKLYLTPNTNEDFETYLNGELVHSRQQMFHGDRLVIGGSHYFRISNPFCPQRGKNKIVDFQLAHQEILHKQEEKLRRELEEEKHVALSRIESERVENERDFNERLQQLELEQLKFKCNREILETERKVLDEETATKRTEMDEALTYTPSFKSTLLEDIHRIMHNPSEESLHKTQLMVKEATQRCRSLGLKLEFRQSKVLDEFGIFRTVVLILDKEHEKKAEWPTARLGVWLEIVREREDLKAENLFNSVDIEWQRLDTELNESLNESLNSSRISLNLSIVKDILLKQPFRKIPKLFSFSSSSGKSKNSPKTTQNLTKSAILNSTQTPNRQAKKMLTYDVEASPSVANTKSPPEISSSPSSPTSNVEQRFAALAAVHVHDMQRSVFRLKRLCKRSCEEHENIRVQKTIRDTIQQLDGILQNMHSCLEGSTLIDSTETSPSKTPKSVRFLVD